MTSTRPSIRSVVENTADAKGKLWKVLEGLESVVHAVDVIKLEADAYRDTILAEAQQQAREHLEKSFAEAQQMLAEAELARNEALEELETQKILTEAAKLREESHEVIEEIRRRLNSSEDSRSGWWRLGSQLRKWKMNQGQS